MIPTVLLLLDRPFLTDFVSVSISVRVLSSGASHGT